MSRPTADIQFTRLAILTLVGPTAMARAVALLLFTKQGGPNRLSTIVVAAAARLR